MQTIDPKKQLHFVRFHISFHQKSVSIRIGYLFINNHGSLSLAKWLILTSHLFGFILFWLCLVWLLWIIPSPIILDLLSVSWLIPIIPQRVAVSKTSVDWWPQRDTLPFIDYIPGILTYAWAGNPQYWGNSGYIVCCFNLWLYILIINYMNDYVH